MNIILWDLIKTIDSNKTKKYSVKKINQETHFTLCKKKCTILCLCPLYVFDNKKNYKHFKKGKNRNKPAFVIIIKWNRYFWFASNAFGWNNKKLNFSFMDSVLNLMIKEGVTWCSNNVFFFSLLNMLLFMTVHNFRNA